MFEFVWFSVGSPYSPSYLPVQHPLKHRSEKHELMWVFTNDPSSNKMVKEEFYFEQVRESSPNFASDIKRIWGN